MALFSGQKFRDSRHIRKQTLHSLPSWRQEHRAVQIWLMNVISIAYTQVILLWFIIVKLHVSTGHIYQEIAKLVESYHANSGSRISLN